MTSERSVKRTDREAKNWNWNDSASLANVGRIPACLNGVSVCAKAFVGYAADIAKRRSQSLAQPGNVDPPVLPH